MRNKEGLDLNVALNTATAGVGESQPMTCFLKLPIVHG